MKKVCISKDWLFREKTSISFRYTGQYEIIDLPHDYEIAKPRSKHATAGSGNGFFESGAADYAKFIKFDKKEHVILDIDGAYMCAEVSLNEDILAMHPHGYTPFLVDLTDKIVWGVHNRLGIKTLPHQPSARWYSGAGIYRDVFLWTGGKVRIEPWDLYMVTKDVNGTNAVVEVRAEITSDIDDKADVNIKILDNSKNVLIDYNESITVSSNEKTKLIREFSMNNVKLWNVGEGNLHKVEVTISQNGEITDTFEQTFGIRLVKANAKEGLTINGRHINMQGGCIHHDHGAIGAAAFPAAEERKVMNLKNAGFNALRIAHNPPSLALMEVCDREGILVMDEAFDMWRLPKRDHDYHLFFADWWDRDISYMVLRDRSHPSVISYSIGNEIRERNGICDGELWSKKLCDEVRKYDETRFVTAGICNCDGVEIQGAPDDYIEMMKGKYAATNTPLNDTGPEWLDVTAGHAKYLDIVGYNYMYLRYADDHKVLPDRVIWGSETHSITFYDSWKAVEENSHVIGDFVWTAHDNLGEVGTGRFEWGTKTLTGEFLADYPWRTCFQGDLDLCGYRRPPSYFREAIWKKSTAPKIFTTHPKHNGEDFVGTLWHWWDVLDTWNFEDEYLGALVKTDVYTVADEVKFTLNGKVVGTAKTESGIASLDIPYERGVLKAEAIKGGKVVGNATLKTVGEPNKIHVIPEKDCFSADRRDLCYFQIIIEDEEGNRIPDSKAELSCIVDGAELMCIFSGDPKNEDQYTSNKCHAFEGRALAVVRTANAGDVRIVVGADGLKSGVATVKAE